MAEQGTFDFGGVSRGGSEQPRTLKKFDLTGLSKLRGTSGQSSGREFNLSGLSRMSAAPEQGTTMFPGEGPGFSPAVALPPKGQAGPQPVTLPSPGPLTPVGGVAPPTPPLDRGTQPAAPTAPAKLPPMPAAAPSIPDVLRTAPLHVDTTTTPEIPEKPIPEGPRLPEMIPAHRPTGIPTEEARKAIEVSDIQKYAKKAVDNINAVLGETSGVDWGFRRGDELLPETERTKAIQQRRNLMEARDRLEKITQFTGQEGFMEGIKENWQSVVPFLNELMVLSESMKVGDLVKKTDRTPEEQALVDSYMALQQFQGMIDRSFGYNVGQGIAGLAGYAGAFAASGPVAAATRGAVRGAVAKWAPREIIRASVEGGALKQLAAKGVTRAIPSIAGGFAQSLTNIPGIVGAAQNRMIDDYRLAIGQEGQIIERQAEGNADSAIEAYLSAIGMNAAEYVTETWGIVAEKPMDLIKKAVVGRWLKKHGVSRVSEALDAIKKKLKWNGIVGEVFEELANAPLSAAAEQRSLKPLVPFTPESGYMTPQQIAETAAVVAIPGLGGAAMRAPGAISRPGVQPSAPAAPAGPSGTVLFPPGEGEAAPPPGPTPAGGQVLFPPEEGGPAPAPQELTDEQRRQMREKTKEEYRKRIATPIPPETVEAAKKAVEAAGGKWIGVQRGIMSDQIMFNEKSSDSTIPLDLSKATVENIRAELDRVKKKFEEQPPKPLEGVKPASASPTENIQQIISSAKENKTKPPIQPIKFAIRDATDDQLFESLDWSIAHDDQFVRTTVSDMIRGEIDKRKLPPREDTSYNLSLDDFIGKRSKGPFTLDPIEAKNIHSAMVWEAVKSGKLSREDYARLHEKDYGPVEQFLAAKPDYATPQEERGTKTIEEVVPPEPAPTAAPTPVKKPNAEAVAYIHNIKNPEKKSYAQEYQNWILGGRVGDPPGAGKLHYMAAQAVRQKLDPLYPEKPGEPAKPKKVEEPKPQKGRIYEGKPVIVWTKTTEVRDVYDYKTGKTSKKKMSLWLGKKVDPRNPSGPSLGEVRAESESDKIRQEELMKFDPDLPGYKRPETAPIPTSGVAPKAVKEYMVSELTKAVNVVLAHNGGKEWNTIEKFSQGWSTKAGETFSGMIVGEDVKDLAKKLSQAGFTVDEKNRIVIQVPGDGTFTHSIGSLYDLLSSWKSLGVAVTAPKIPSKTATEGLPASAGLTSLTKADVPNTDYAVLFSREAATLAVIKQAAEKIKPSEPFTFDPEKASKSIKEWVKAKPIPIVKLGHVIDDKDFEVQMVSRDPVPGTKAIEPVVIFKNGNDYVVLSQRAYNTVRKLLPNSQWAIGADMIVAVEGDKIVAFANPLKYVPEKKEGAVPVGKVLWTADNLYEKYGDLSFLGIKAKTQPKPTLSQEEQKIRESWKPFTPEERKKIVNEIDWKKAGRDPVGADPGGDFLRIPWDKQDLIRLRRQYPNAKVLPPEEQKNIEIVDRAMKPPTVEDMEPRLSKHRQAVLYALQHNLLESGDLEWVVNYGTAEWDYRASILAEIEKEQEGEEPPPSGRTEMRGPVEPGELESREPTIDPQNIEWAMRPGSKGDVLIEVDVAKLDKSFQRDAGFYIGPDDPGIGQRRQSVTEAIRQGKTLIAPDVSINPATGNVSFTDGRHRFAVARDLGARTVMVAVPQNQEQAFKVRFGSKPVQIAMKPGRPSAGWGRRGSIGMPAVMEPVNRGELVRLSTIIQDLQRDLKVPIRKGHGGFGGGTLGFYKIFPEAIRMKIANDIVVITHEIAHHIDKKFLGGWSPAARGRFARWNNELKPLDYDQTQRRAYEGFAEWMRHWLTMDDAPTVAPTFTKYFLEEFLPQHPDLQKTLLRAKDQITRWREQGAEGRILANIDFSRAKARPTIRELYDSMRLKFKTAWVNRLEVLNYAVDEMLENAGVDPSDIELRKHPGKIAMAVEKTAAAKARAFVMDGAFNFFGQKIGKSLREIMAPVAKDIKKAIGYAYAVRAKFLLEERGIDPGISLEDANYYIEKYRTPELETFVKELTEWNGHLLDYLVDGGALTGSAAKTIRDSNAVYIPLKRVFLDMQDVMSGGSGRGYVDLPNPIKRIRGSSREIINPLESMIAQAEQFIAIADKARVVRALVDLTDKERGGVPGTARWVERIKDINKVTTFTLKGLRRQLERYGLDVIDKQTGEQLEPDQMNALISLFQLSKKYYGRENIAAVTRNGETEFYEFHPALFNALKGLDKITLHWAVNMFLGAPARAVRLGATGIRAGFALISNPIRDAWTYAIQSERTAGFPWMALKGVVESIKGGEAKQLFRFTGGEMAQPLGMDRKMVQTLVEEALATGVTGKGKVLAKHPIEVLKEIFSVTEAGPRIAEVRGTMAKWQPQIDAALRAGDNVRARELQENMAIDIGTSSQEVTVNFRRMGTYSAVLNQIIPFFNPSIQGISRFYRTATEHPLRTGIRAVCYLTAPTLLLWYINKDEDWYKELHDWMKYGFWNFKIGETFYHLPKPFEWGYLFAGVPESVANAVYTDNPELVGDALTEFVRQTSPVSVENPALVIQDVALFKPLIETYYNWDTYREKPIVPKEMEQLIVTEQYLPYTSEFAKEASSLLSNISVFGKKLEIAPADIDHLLSGYTGGLANDIIKGFPGEIKEKADIPVIGRVFTRADAVQLSGKSVSEFYEQYEEANRVKRTVERYLRLEPGEIPNPERVERTARILQLDERAILLYKKWDVLEKTRLSIQEMRDAQKEVDALNIDPGIKQQMKESIGVAGAAVVRGIVAANREIERSYEKARATSNSGQR